MKSLHVKYDYGLAIIFTVFFFILVTGTIYSIYHVFYINLSWLIIAVIIFLSLSSFYSFDFLVSIVLSSFSIKNGQFIVSNIFWEKTINLEDDFIIKKGLIFSEPVTYMVESNSCKIKITKHIMHFNTLINKLYRHSNNLDSFCFDEKVQFTILDKSSIVALIFILSMIFIPSIFLGRDWFSAIIIPIIFLSLIALYIIYQLLTKPFSICLDDNGINSISVIKTVRFDINSKTKLKLVTQKHLGYLLHFLEITNEETTIKIYDDSIKVLLWDFKNILRSKYKITA